jgi:gas vesicle protein
MKTYIQKSLFIGMFALVSVVFPQVLFAQADQDIVAIESTLSTEFQVVKEKTKMQKNRIMAIIEKWRKDQAEMWSSIKAEKQEQVAARDNAMDQGLLDRTNRVLEGEQVSLVQDSFEDFDGNIFLLKLYIAALSIFVAIFNQPVVFYTIGVVLGLGLISRIYRFIFKS